jgi:hypothetical protein
VILLFVVRLAPAQPAASSLTGIVTSEGSPLPHVTVTVASDALLVNRVTRSGAGGHYYLRELPPGLYDVYFEGAGVQTLVRRVKLEVARISRLDAELARTEAAETVTSTSLMPTLLESPQLATNLDKRTVDRLPLGRSIRERLVLAPGFPTGESLSLIDGVELRETVEEAVEETTIITAAASAEYAFAPGGVLASVTGRGGNDFSAALRGTFSDGGKAFFEAAGGGRIVTDRVWFFIAGSDGETNLTDEARSLVGRLSAAITDGHTLDVSHYAVAGEPDQETWSARYDGQLAAILSTHFLATRDQWSATGHLFHSSTRLGSHSVIVGAEDPGPQWSRAVYVNDFWRLAPQWSINAGLRYTEEAEERLGPRIGAVYDVLEDGEHRISASWGRYSDREGATVDETTVAYGWRFSVLGYARADYIRRKAGAPLDLLQFHGSYDLFRLIRLGGNYTKRVRGESDLRHRFNGWIWYERPVGDRTVTFALLQRYLGAESESFASTDLSAMLSLPAANVMAFLKADLVNTFDDEDLVIDAEGLALPRTWRVVAGVRF